MNERIKSLIERAEYQAKKQSGYEDWEVYVTPDSQVVFEKFAELIVAECLKIVEPDRTSGDEWCLTLDETAQSIRQHFGVKE